MHIMQLSRANTMVHPPVSLCMLLRLFVDCSNPACGRYAHFKNFLKALKSSDSFFNPWQFSMFYEKKKT